MKYINNNYISISFNFSHILIISEQSILEYISAVLLKFYSKLYTTVFLYLTTSLIKSNLYLEKPKFSNFSIYFLASDLLRPLVEIASPLSVVIKGSVLKFSAL